MPWSPAKLKTGIDENTAMFRSAFGTLQEHVLNWKPSPQNWSIAQIVEHLMIINESYYPVIQEARKARSGLPWYSSIPWVARKTGNAILKSVKPGTSKKTRTFKIWQPSERKISGDILLKFEEHHDVLKGVIDENADLIMKGTIIHSPANKYIIYPLPQAFEIIVAHEQRHYRQAMQVLRLYEQQQSG